MSRFASYTVYQSCGSIHEGHRVSSVRVSRGNLGGTIHRHAHGAAHREVQSNYSPGEDVRHEELRRATLIEDCGVQAPNGHLIVSNNDAVNPDPNQPSELVEFSKDGHFVNQISVDQAQGGSFGLAATTTGKAAKLAAVDDNQNIILIWTLTRL